MQGTHVNGQAPAGAPAVSSERRVVASFRLAKPVKGYRETHERIDLREPTVGDYIDIGEINVTTLQPVPGGEGAAMTVVTDPQAIGKWFERLSGLPMSALMQVAMSDARPILAKIKELVGGLDAKN